MGTLRRIDERFSAESFRRAGLDSDEARQLADELGAEIVRELDEVVKQRMETAIAVLNSMGHDLTVFAPSGSHAGEIAFADETREGGKPKCKLRVAVNIVVSTGYAHLIYLS